MTLENTEAVHIAKDCVLSISLCSLLLDDTVEADSLSWVLQQIYEISVTNEVSNEDMLSHIVF